MMTKCQFPLFQIINPFLSSATKTSVYKILMIMPLALQISVPHSPSHDLQQFKYGKKFKVYIFLTSFFVQVASALSVHYIW